MLRRQNNKAKKERVSHFGWVWENERQQPAVITGHKIWSWLIRGVHRLCPVLQLLLNRSLSKKCRSNLFPAKALEKNRTCKISQYILYDASAAAVSQCLWFGNPILHKIHRNSDEQERRHKKLTPLVTLTLTICVGLCEVLQLCDLEIVLNLDASDVNPAGAQRASGWRSLLDLWMSYTCMRRRKKNKCIYHTCQPLQGANPETYNTKVTSTSTTSHEDWWVMTPFSLALKLETE